MVENTLVYNISAETSPVSYFLLVPSDDFSVERSGDVDTKRGLKSGMKHLLYVYARDGNMDHNDTKFSE